MVNGKNAYYVGGKPANGWYTVSGVRYYFDSQGFPTTGMKTISGKKYFFLANGKLAAGYGDGGDWNGDGYLTAAANVNGRLEILLVDNSGIVQKETAITGSGKGYNLALKGVQYLGMPYVYAGNSLTAGTDCSGFVYLIHQMEGLSIPRSTYTQVDSSFKRSNNYLMGTIISATASSLKPGDLIYYNGNGHVAMYIGGGMIIHASHEAAYPEGGIKISNYNYTSITQAIRFWS